MFLQSQYDLEMTSTILPHACKVANKTPIQLKHKFERCTNTG